MPDETVSLFIAKRTDANPKEGEGKYGNVEFADAKNKKYPIDTEEHIRAAWNYINKSGNAGKYSSEDAKAIKAKIVAAWKDKISKDGPPSDMGADELNTYAVDEYVATVPGDPYRLLPFGKLVKGGISHNITPEYAARFKIPHFLPPIKLGSHDETTPSGGTITKIEVRTTGDNPGLYAYPEFTPQGLKAIENGDFRYQSPEIVWDNGAYENPQTGELMEGPFIIGDALLHVPHLGQSAAMYSFEPIYKGANMEEKIEVPKSLWEQFGALFAGKKPDPQTPATVTPEQFAAAMQERDDMKARLETLETEKKSAAQVDAMTAEIKGEKYGQLFKDEKFAAEAAGIFVAIPEAQRKWVLQKFAALSAEVKMSKLLAEFGQAGEHIKQRFARPGEIRAVW